MGARAILAAVIALLAAAVPVAQAIVRSESDVPRIGSDLWSGHPKVLRLNAMAGVGKAAAKGQLPSAETMAQVQLFARRAPLEPEPFLIEGAIAQKAGNADRARQLLVAARTRDPRSSAARFLLADQYVRDGDLVVALVETTVLTRLVPGLADQLAPRLAAYARTPGAVGSLRQLFNRSPDPEPALLLALSSNAANADLVMAIASRQSLSGDGAWRTKLLTSLVDSGAHAKAYSVWRRLAGVNGPVEGLYRPDFALDPAPPPFNWTLAQGGAGLAERAAGGGLRILHYGRIETVLASQLTLLRPGRYRLAMSVRGETGAEAPLRWKVRCRPSGTQVGELPLTDANARQAAVQFDVPSSNCVAQSIELVGVMMETPKSVEVTISPLQLSRAGA